MERHAIQDGKKGGSGSADVLLQYIDDDLDSYSNIFDNAKTSCSEADKARLIAALKTLSGEDASSAVDVDMVIRYFVAHNFVLNFDSYTGSMIHNYYLYEKGGQLQMIPWDYNLAFGGFQSSGGATALVNYPIDTPVSGGSIDERPMLAWIFADEEYTALYHQYFAEFIAEYFDSGYFSDMMDSVKAMIAPYVQQDPTKFCTYEEFETGIDTLKAFCLLRAESISAQLSGAIGSTSDTQDEATLIDAGSLQISDMGSMGGGMGKNIGNSIGDDIGDPIGNGTDSDAPQPNNGQDTQTDASDRPSPPDGTPLDFSDDSMDRTPPDFSGGTSGKTPPDFSGDASDRTPPDPSGGASDRSAENQGQPSSLLLMGGSAAVLLAGLAFALLYKRRK